MRVPTFKRFPALAKSYCRFTRHDLHASRVLLTITLKRCRHGGPYLHPCYHRCLLLCLESRPHDLYALGGSTEPVVAPQWIFGQPKKPKNPSFPRRSPWGAQHWPCTRAVLQRALGLSWWILLSPADGVVDLWATETREPLEIERRASSREEID